jgi:hypothetical protein
VPLLLQTALGGGVGCLNNEGQREEMHRFVENDNNSFSVI